MQAVPELHRIPATAELPMQAVEELHRIPATAELPMQAVEELHRILATAELPIQAVEELPKSGTCWEKYNVGLALARQHALEVHKWMDAAVKQETQPTQPLSDELQRRHAQLYSTVADEDGTIMTLLADALRCDNLKMYFLQVGAFQGDSVGDPLFNKVNPRRWSGILVEPSPLAFKQLLANYKIDENGARTIAQKQEVSKVLLKDQEAEIEQKLCAINAGITAERGTFSFFMVDIEGGIGTKHADARKLPYWAQELSSFDKQHLIRHQRFLDYAPNTCKKFDSEPDCVSEAITENVKQTQVDGLTFEDVFARCGGASSYPALLVIDAEGRDAEIIRQFPFKIVKPRVIYFEHAHLNAPGERAAIAKYLEEVGYSVSFHWRSLTMSDTYAFY